MAATEEGKIDIGKLQLKLFAGPNGINVLDLVPGKAPPLRPKSPLPQCNETIFTVTETPRPILPTIQLDINLNEDDEHKSDDERLDEDNVLSSLCKKRIKKPNVRPPSRTFVKRLGSSSSSEEVTVLIDTKVNTPLNVVDKQENDPEINLSTKVNHLVLPSNDDLVPRSLNSDEVSVILPKNQINTSPPVKPKHNDTEKQLNITLITKALQERNAKKKEFVSTDNIEPPKVNFLNVLDKPGDALKETKGLNSNTSLSPKNEVGKKPPPPVSPKPSMRKKFNISTKDDKPLKPSDIAKEQRNVRNTDNIEQKKKTNMIISPKEESTIATPTKEDSTRKISTKEDILKTRIDSLKDRNSIKATLEQITKKNNEKTKDETISANSAEVGKPVSLEIKEDRISERYNKDISDSTYNIEDPTLRLRSNTHSLKRPETSEITYNRTLSEGSKIPKTTPKLERTQSEIPKLRKEVNKSSNEKDELSNKTYLELETLKNISQKSNDKSQGNDKSIDSRKLPTQRTFGSIENISVKRYQRIETSDYFKYKKTGDDPRAKENENFLTANEKNDTSELFKSKVDGHKDSRIRERSNTTDVKSNIKYVPYSSGKITNSLDTFTPSTYNRSLSSNDASLLPRFKSGSGHTSSIVTKSNLVKPCTSFPSRVLDRFMPKTNTTIETKRSTTYT